MPNILHPIKRRIFSGDAPGNVMRLVYAPASDTGTVRRAVDSSGNDRITFAQDIDEEWAIGDVLLLMQKGNGLYGAWILGAQNAGNEYYLTAYPLDGYLPRELPAAVGWPGFSPDFWVVNLTQLSSLSTGPSAPVTNVGLLDQAVFVAPPNGECLGAVLCNAANQVLAWIDDGAQFHFISSDGTTTFHSPADVRIGDTVRSMYGSQVVVTSVGNGYFQPDAGAADLIIRRGFPRTIAGDSDYTLTIAATLSAS